MSFGYFNDEKKEFVIKDMYPKRPWVNYIWNEKHISTIDQFGFGTSSYIDDNYFRRSILKPTDSRIIYIKDEDTKEYYAANRNYYRKDFDKFETTVGQGYSIISSEYKNIGFDFNVFIPETGLNECWSVTVKNTGDKTKNISLYAYANMDIALSPHWAYTNAYFYDDLGGMYFTHDGFQLPTDVTGVFFAGNIKCDSFETTNRRFRGVYGTLQNPDALVPDTLSGEGTSFDNDMAPAMQYRISLKSGESKKLLFVLGAARNLDEAIEFKNNVLSEEKFEKELLKIKEKNTEFSRRVTVNTPDEEVNRFVNIWLKRQMELGKTWGRVYGRGFRDIMQDTTGFAQLDPAVSREKILYCLEYQKTDGNTIRQWQRIDYHPYRDGASWLIPAVVTYIKETNDFTILDEKVKYFESDLVETVFEHCERGINFLQTQLGEHGLCLWEGGDWNDSFNNCGMQLKGESAWLTEATVKSSMEFADLLCRIGKSDKANKIKTNAEKLKENILKNAWDKDHFIYGINDWGEKIGSYETKEGQILLNAQTWAVLSEVVEDAKAVELMDFVERELKCPFGYVQQKPSYSQGTDHIGRISYMEKGSYENGSVYNHGVAFKIVADCKLKRGNLAYKSIKMMLPSNPDNPCTHSGMEPYVLSNMYLGPENKLRAGESLTSWITGTAGWMFRGMVEFLIGVRAEYDGLLIDPALPDEWKTVNVKREFRGAAYDICINNKKSKGNINITVDGNNIEGNILPVFSDGETHKVEVTIG